ncbi:MAG: beta-galactosidase [Armatimonadetes bacterium]|nr:beta-galactosidase [Armatimonadota bacterium]
MASWIVLAALATMAPPDWPLLGRLATRPASAVAASTWSVGGETLDRDFAHYAKYRAWLGPLGAKALRVQAGWAKCEKQRGVYDFAWLDEVVDDARAQGVQPWLETSYGNPIYPGGGGTGLGGAFPSSPEAVAGWEAWVRALVHHFRDRVDEWEIWNEPDLSKSNTAAGYVELYQRTAAAIRAEQPQARLYALGLAGNVAFAKEVLTVLRERGKLGLVDAVTMHTYPDNPDNLASILALRSFVHELDPRLGVRQGETGAPSTAATFGALSGRPWTELTQAKWDLRRMLAHHAQGIPFNLFTLMELNYTGRWNTKGLLKANEDGTVAYAKPAYRAAQRVFGVFDGQLLGSDAKVTASVDGLALQPWCRRDGGPWLLTVWSKAAPPTESDATTPVDLTVYVREALEPVYCDLLSGEVRAVPRANWSVDGQALRLTGILVGDWPVIVAERAALPLAP